MYCMTYSTSYFFSTINNISILVNNPSFTYVFFKHACHANPGADKNNQDLVHVFQ